MQIIIGSYALNYTYGDRWRKPKDYDVWISEDENKENIKSDLPIDLYIFSEEILKSIPCIQYTNFATPNAIYTIKCSHFGWDIFWEKHKQDIIYLKFLGCKIIPDLYEKLINFWKIEHGNKNHLSLNKTKEEFFNDYVNYKYDHDLLHEIVALPNQPIYKSVLKNGKEVLIDKEKFLKLSKEFQIELFREEIKTIALERYLIPSQFKIGKLKAYKLALKKTIIDLTKNWATLFIIENLYEFNHTGNANWYNNFINFDQNKKIMMNKILNHSEDIIQQIKIKANELNICEDHLKQILLHGSKWHLDYNEKFKQFLKKFDFYHLHKEGGGEGGTEHCESVIELKGCAYKIEYSYYSHIGYSIDDLWDWKPVVAKTKTIIYYE